MAEAAPVDLTTVQCGFCLQQGGLETLKSLPCSHIHCLTCLTENYDVYGVVRCPWCREVYDVTVNSLPSAHVREDNSPSCDVCTKKGIKNQSAVTYCTVCSKLYCAEHRELHDALHDDHHKTTLDEYKQEARKLEIRVCADHKLFPYNLGCKVCATLLCVQCVPGIGVCTDGSAHQLVYVDDLVRELITVDELISREDELSALFKQTSKFVSDFDTGTEKLLATLHKHRDQQLNTLRLKYEKLEKEFLDGRRKTKLEMTRFMEEDVGVKWSDMSKNRMKIEAQLKHSHQVDIVNGHAKIKDEIETLLSDELPKLELCDVITLKVKGERRDIEAEVISASDLLISLAQLIQPAPSPPSNQPTFLQADVVYDSDEEYEEHDEHDELSWPSSAAPRAAATAAAATTAQYVQQIANQFVQTFPTNQRVQHVPTNRSGKITPPSPFRPPVYMNPATPFQKQVPITACTQCGYNLALDYCENCGDYRFCTRCRFCTYCGYIQDQ